MLDAIVFSYGNRLFKKEAIYDFFRYLVRIILGELSKE